MYSDLESSKAELLGELYRRLKWGPVVRGDLGNYARVSGIISTQFPDPWPGIKFFGETSEYTLSAIESIVLYPKSAIYHEIMVSGEMFTPIVRLGVMYCKEIYPSFSESDITVTPDFSSQKAEVHYRGEYIITVNNSVIYSLEYAMGLLDSWMIDWKGASSEYCIYAIPDRLLGCSPLKKYCSHNPFEIFG